MKFRRQSTKVKGETKANTNKHLTIKKKSKWPKQSKSGKTMTAKGEVKSEITKGNYKMLTKVWEKSRKSERKQKKKSRGREHA